ncbi:hypothetical protein [Sporosarcina sp. G11-34]|uniref:hypothetical protein n=1 Tax=Sporosarcina sp. G11-34 TaxID=2849605 RepID=UPI0022A949C5|nr:hypothetical protein [Sporosarcina sp. G11-34]MCZ2259900.1 hypothetical protein [Sporosarcina sp. G11-34]
MAKDDRKEIKVESEMRTKEISNMIDEGGLGAEEYYEVKKVPPTPQSKTERDKQNKEDKDD